MCQSHWVLLTCEDRVQHAVSWLEGDVNERFHKCLGLGGQTASHTFRRSVGWWVKYYPVLKGENTVFNTWNTEPFPGSFPNQPSEQCFLRLVWAAGPTHHLYSITEIPPKKKKVWQSNKECVELKNPTICNNVLHKRSGEAMVLAYLEKLECVEYTCRYEIWCEFCTCKRSWELCVPT